MKYIFEFADFDKKLVQSMDIDTFILTSNTNYSFYVRYDTSAFKTIAPFLKKGVLQSEVKITFLDDNGEKIQKIMFLAQIESFACFNMQPFKWDKEEKEVKSLKKAQGIAMVPTSAPRLASPLAKAKKKLKKLKKTNTDDLDVEKMEEKIESFISLCFEVKSTVTFE